MLAVMPSSSPGRASSPLGHWPWGDSSDLLLGVAVPWLVYCVARVRRDSQLVRTRSLT